MSLNVKKGDTVLVLAGKDKGKIDASNVQVICPTCGKATRINNVTVDGKKIRQCKKCSANLDAAVKKETKKTTTSTKAPAKTTATKTAATKAETEVVEKKTTTKSTTAKTTTKKATTTKTTKTITPAEKPEWFDKKIEKEEMNQEELDEMNELLKDFG